MTIVNFKEIAPYLKSWKHAEVVWSILDKQATGEETLRLAFRVIGPRDASFNRLYLSISVRERTDLAMLSSLCRACGISTLARSEQLHGVPVKVMVKPEYDESTGRHEPRIAKFAAVSDLL